MHCETKMQSRKVTKEVVATHLSFSKEMQKRFLLVTSLLGTLALFLGVATLVSAAQLRPKRVDIARAPAPLFDDPEWHGATDPFVIWNSAKRKWFMYYTQRRASLLDPIGVNWVHGSKIGIATSDDG